MNKRSVLTSFAVTAAGVALAWALQSRQAVPAVPPSAETASEESVSLQETCGTCCEGAAGSRLSLLLRQAASEAPAAETK